MFTQRGQVAIWIILGVLFVGAIVLFFLLRNSIELPTGGQHARDFQVRDFLTTCARSALSEGSDTLLSRSGFLSPADKPVPFRYYDGNPVVYLCVHMGYYQPCVAQHPLYLRELEGELRLFVQPALDSCLTRAKEEGAARHIDVSYTTPQYSVVLGSDKASVTFLTDVTVTSDTGTVHEKDFTVNAATPLFNLAQVALEISAQEAAYCSFETAGYHLSYPRYSIQKDILADSTKIYTISDSRSGKKLRIATRGCVVPPGFA